jgi:hypothetical protein
VHKFSSIWMLYFFLPKHKKGRRNYKFFFQFLLSLCLHMIIMVTFCLLYVLWNNDNLAQTSTITSYPFSEFHIHSAARVLFSPSLSLIQFYIYIGFNCDYSFIVSADWWPDYISFGFSQSRSHDKRTGKARFWPFEKLFRLSLIFERSLGNFEVALTPSTQAFWPTGEMFYARHSRLSNS